MPKDDINYKFTENGIVYDFYDVFVPAENFRQPSLLTWGWNGSGRLGINQGGNNRLTPVTTLAGGTTWKQVSCGLQHIAAIKTDGTLWTWGHNDFSQLGNFTNTARSTPVTTFAGGNNWKQVDCGRQLTAAVKTDGSLWIWGSNFAVGQLGTNDNTDRRTPVTTFAGGNNWKSVSIGNQHTAAIKTDGTLWVWGRNTSAQLGINVGDGTHRSTPVTTFSGGTNWKSVSGGYIHTTAIKTDGTLWTWGVNNQGQLGTNDTTTRSTPVTTFAGGTNWKQVAPSTSNNYIHTTAIKTDGTLWTWGLNNQGQLGTNNTTQQNAPVTTFTGGNNWKEVSCGEEFSAAIKYSPDP
jgi:alpha-tubulin suppressor-like RCC1 family protein